MNEDDVMTGEELGEKLLQSVREMKAGKAARVTHVAVSPAAEARHKVGLSQAEFAELLGVSRRTLQDWEQGRRANAAARCSAPPRGVAGFVVDCDRRAGRAPLRGWKLEDRRYAP